MFLGPKGMRTIFHWDGDHRHVLLTQIFGKKRVYLVSPEESPSMMPVFNMSAFNFQDLSPEEKVRFIRERNGLIADIGPGDTLFFPKTFWHYVEYVTDSMSVNVRFRSNLSENLFAACNGLYQVQMLGFSIRNENTALKVASEILRTFNRKYTGGIARYDATVSHLNAACMKHCTQAFKKARTYPDLNPERLALETRSPSVTRKPGYGFDSPIDSAALDSPHPIHQGRIENVLKILKPTPQQLAWLKQVLGLDALPGESGDAEETAYVAHVFQFFPGAYLPR
jgi:hypothetical protein